MVTLLACGLILIPGEVWAPIAEPVLRAAPFRRSVTQVGATQALGAIAYLVVALPIGCLNDVLAARGEAPAGRGFQALMLAGGVLMIGSFWLIRKASLDALPGSAYLWYVVGYCGTGVACALTILPSLPDLQLGLAADDETSKTRIVATWNALLALGASLGAQAGAALYHSSGVGLVCTVMMATSAVLVADMVVGLVIARTGACRRGGGARRGHPLVQPLNANAASGSAP